MRYFALLFVFVTSPVFGFGQDCPKDNGGGPPTASAVRDLMGTLVFHNDLRQWFELKLDVPVCNVSSLELVTGDRGWRSLQVVRGCRVRSRGIIDVPSTGYYSISLYQDVTSIEAEGNCKRQRAFPDYSKLKPESSIRKYHVAMRIYYQSDGPLEVNVKSGRRELKPRQAYASYFLTGGFAYYAYCGKGFVAEHPIGTREGKPWTIDGYVAFDPESVPKGVDPILLDYNCRRARRGEM